MSRALQDLKAFGGADVSEGGMDPRAAQFTGGKLPPLPGQLLPDVTQGKPEAFTGTKPEGVNPIGDAIQTEMATRGKLRSRTEAPDLSQEDFEADLIANSKSIPESPEEPPPLPGQALPPVERTTAGPQAASATSEVIDLDTDFPEPLRIGEASQPTAPRPAGQPNQPAPLTSNLPPVRISKGGKSIYESTGPSGRWEPMVKGVFEPFLAHQDPQIAAAANRAQAISTKLIGVDGVAPKEAIKMGMEYLQGEATRITNLQRTEMGTRPKYFGGGGGSGVMGKKQDAAESIRGYIKDGQTATSKLGESDRLLQQAEALANSPDPALQRNAIDILVQSRSGATVSDRERARYDQLDGAISQAQNFIARWTGGPLDPEYVNKIKMVIAEQRRINQVTREEIATDLTEAYAAQNEGKIQDPKVFERRKKAVTSAIKRGDSGGEDPNADLYE